MEVQILSRNLITPSNPTPQHLRYYKLSLFDQLAPPSYIRIILFYPADGGEGTSQRDEKYGQLRRSFAESLTKFYPLAGRISKDELSVDCSDQGVEYIEAEVNRELTDFLHDGLQIEILDRFMPHHEAAADLGGRALASVQINIFRCGGLSIGFSVSHRIVDTSTLIAFIRGWSTTSRVGISDMVRPDFDVPLLFPVTEDFLKPQPWQVNIGSKIVSRRFIFKGSLISKFRTEFRKTVSCNNSQPSRVTVVTAVIWKALINVARAKYGHLRPSLVAPAMSLLGKIAQIKSDCPFGNLWMPVIARYTANRSTLELQDLVVILDDAVRRTAEKSKKASKDEIVLMATDAFREVINEMLFNNGVDVFTCTSWCRFPANEADFGWGKPCWVSSVSRPYEMFTLVDSRCDDGIEAVVCLNEKDMPQLNQDADFLAFTSQTIGI